MMLLDALVFLVAAIVTVPLAHRFGMSAVLGYLIAGVVIGPSMLSLSGDVSATLHFGEIGVVMLLFIIGVELPPMRLWRMRRLVFGLGTLQITGTMLVLLPLLVAVSMPIADSVLLAFAFALSSTAFGLQFLAERKVLTHPHGRAAFGVLLFQDLAAVPALAVLSLLATPATDQTSLWLRALTLTVLVAAVVLARLAMRPLLRAMARTGIPELFTAAALCIVIGAAVGFERAGLSAGLGAFVAGMLVGESEYRHQLQTDIEPFKGLLLGLFFIAVGMSANLDLLLTQPLLVLVVAAALIAAKMLVLFAVSGRFVAEARERLRLAVTLSQGGEFAFVLLALAVKGDIIDTATSELAVLVIALSMASTPPLAVLVDRLVGRQPEPPSPAADEVGPREHTVVIAGFGRFGQIVARVLITRGIRFTALDYDAAQIELLRKTGNEVFYGDASRPDLLRSAHVAEARVFVIAVGSVDASNRIAETLRREFPHVRILARALDRQHALRLRAIGVHYVIRETLLSSMALAREALLLVGLSRSEAERTLERFAAHDAEVLERQFAVRQDEGAFTDVSRAALRELSSLFDEDIRQARPEIKEATPIVRERQGEIE